MLEEEKRRKILMREKYPVPSPLKAIDDILEKGLVVDFKYSTHSPLLLLRTTIKGRATIKRYDIEVDVHPFKRYRR